jgi:hypothetical protein
MKLIKFNESNTLCRQHQEEKSSEEKTKRQQDCKTKL